MHDDNSDPSVALDLTRGLVERDGLCRVERTLGNLAVQRYLNENQIRQLFVASGGTKNGKNPKAFPWTMGLQLSYRAEGRVYANYLQALYPGRKIVVLWENDQFGRDLFKGLEEGVGDLTRLIIVDIAYEMSDAYLETHMSILKRSGAEIFVFAGVPANAARAVRIAAELNRHRVSAERGLPSASIASTEPAGLEKASASATLLKDVSDPAWERHGNGGCSSTSIIVKVRSGRARPRFGYAAAETLTQVLKQCGDHVSRENIMRQAAAPKDHGSAYSVARNQDEYWNCLDFQLFQAVSAGSVRWPDLARSATWSKPPSLGRDRTPGERLLS